MIRTLLIDDETLVRSGLRMILDAAPDIEVVGEGEDGEEAVRLADELSPDVVLLDIRMPGTDGITAASRLTALPDAPRVVLLTTFDLDEYVHAALRAGAVGFLLKDTPPRDLISAVRTVHEGNAMLVAERHQAHAGALCRTRPHGFGGGPQVGRAAAVGAQ